jgi:hypothetical protein
MPFVRSGAAADIDLNAEDLAPDLGIRPLPNRKTHDEITDRTGEAGRVRFHRKPGWDILFLRDRIAIPMQKDYSMEDLR